MLPLHNTGPRDSSAPQAHTNPQLRGQISSLYIVTASQQSHPTHPSSNISIQPIVLPLQKLLLNQPIDVPLNPADLQRAPVSGRLDCLRDQLRVADALPRLQDADNGRLGLVVAVGGDALVGFLVLGGRLFELHRVDLDAVFGVAEGGVEGEGVGGGDVAAFGVLGEGAQFRAGKGLEGAVEFGRGYVVLARPVKRLIKLTQASGFLQVVVVDVLVGWLAIEEEKHDGLERGNNKFLVAFGELGFDLAVCKRVL